jgi:iron complex transport system ATP-binding protein
VLAGLRAPYRGACSYKGVEVSAWKRRDFARSVAFLPQSVKIEFPFTVEEVVMMGRTPYARGWLETAQDHAAVQQALEVTDATGFVGRDFRTLSGGERQRVILASALAQEPETLLLDEPTTFLDLKHQLSMYRLLAKLGEKLLVVTVTHDLNLALQFSSRMLILQDGRLAADGETAQVLSADNVERVFGVHARVFPGNPPHLTYEA